MKDAILVIEGLADDPLEELEGRTPLEAARTPALDRLAAEGRVGSVRLVPPGEMPTDDVTLLALLGYDPRRWGPGPGVLESMGAGRDDGDAAILRLDAVTTAEGRLVDARAGGIRQAETAALLEEVSAALEASRPDLAASIELVATGDHRGLLVDRTGRLGPALATVPPMTAVGGPATRGRPAGEHAEIVLAVLDAADLVLPGHEVNAVRRDLGELPASTLWAWGAGRPRGAPPPVEERLGVSAALVADHPLAGGLARLTGWRDERVEPQAGPVPPARLAERVIQVLERGETVLAWCRTVEAAAHAGDAIAKMAAIEAVDRDLVAPVAEALLGADAWRLLVLPGHATPLAALGHDPRSVPMLLAGTRVGSVLREPFTEAGAEASDLHVEHGWELLEYVLHGSGMRQQDGH